MKNFILVSILILSYLILSYPLSCMPTAYAEPAEGLYELLHLDKHELSKISVLYQNGLDVDSLEIDIKRLKELATKIKCSQIDKSSHANEEGFWITAEYENKDTEPSGVYISLDGRVSLSYPWHSIVVDAEYKISEKDVNKLLYLINYKGMRTRRNEAVTMLLLALLITPLGIMNIRGNISSIHWYNRRKITEETRPKYGKLMGIGSLIIAAGLGLSGAFTLLDLGQASHAPGIVGCIAGVMFILYAQFKYNRGLF